MIMMQRFLQTSTMRTCSQIVGCSYIFRKYSQILNSKLTFICFSVQNIAILTNNTMKVVFMIKRIIGMWWAMPS